MSIETHDAAPEEVLSNYNQELSNLTHDQILQWASELTTKMADIELERAPILEPAQVDAAIREESIRARRLAGEVGLAIQAMLKNQPNDMESSLVAQNIIQSASEIQNKAATSSDQIVKSKDVLLQLYELNRELLFFLAQPRTPEGFITGQNWISKYFFDQYYDSRNQSASSEVRPLTPEEVSEGQQEIMKRINLRDYEGKTTNTQVTLENLIPAIYEAAPDTSLTILDIGAGEGRIAIPLAALGHKINALDLSPSMKGAITQRAAEFRDDYLYHEPNELVDTTISTMNKLNARTNDTETDIERITEHIKAQTGNFFNLDRKAYSELFGEQPADVAIIMWHTFGFAGDHDGQLKVLQNIYANLKQGGRIIIEMPDRNFGPYARAVREFHAQELAKKQSDPDYKPLPLGALIDAPSNDNGNLSTSSQSVSAPRYFPSNEEISDVLGEAGFNILDTKNYFVPQQSHQDKTLVIKENLFIAEKAA